MENLSPLNNKSNQFEFGQPVSKFNKRMFFYMVGLILFLIFFYFFVFSAPNNFPIGNVINIKEGSSLRAISKELKTNKVIRSRAAFETLVIIYGGDKNISLGDYLFEKITENYG